MLARRSRALRGRARPRVGADRGPRPSGLPFADASFDALTFTYLLRYVEDPAATLRELARVVRPGGRVARWSSACRHGRPPRGWRLYTAVGLPPLGRLASREWGEVGRFLGPSIRGFYARHPLDRIVGYWPLRARAKCGVRRMSFGGGVVMSARKGATLTMVETRAAPSTSTTVEPRRPPGAQAGALVVSEFGSGPCPRGQRSGGRTAWSEVLLVLAVLAANLDQRIDDQQVDDHADATESGDQAWRVLSVASLKARTMARSLANGRGAGVVAFGGPRPIADRRTSWRGAGAVERARLEIA